MRASPPPQALLALHFIADGALALCGGLAALAAPASPEFGGGGGGGGGGGAHVWTLEDSDVVINLDPELEASHRRVHIYGSGL